MLYVTPMRRASLCTTLVVAVLTSLASSGCTLYFGDDQQSYDDVYYPPDAQPYYPDASDPPPPPAYTFARCENGTIRHISLASLPNGDMPGHGAGTLAGTCPNGCRSAIAACSSPYDCTQADQKVCNAPPAIGAPTQLQGTTCSGTATASYGETSRCGEALPGGSCTCTNGKYACTPATNTAEIHASLVGKWSGMVSPPDFTTPYPVTLWIYADGTYWGECTQGPSYCNAFYYGGDGPHPWRRINVLANSTSNGAYADIGLFYSFNVGALSNIYVSDTTLTFTYNAAWHSCAQPFYFTLTRQ